jgi:phosphoribosylaminoimidazolecarboxamide formyltransferase/IMP cyclohydrolase
MERPIKNALISVFHKDGLEPIVDLLNAAGVQLYSTGGTQKFIEGRGVKVHRVEDLTGYPSILDGRVKTLHPKVFGGILARREQGHLAQLESYDIPEFDLVIVDLYPFRETVRSTDDEDAIIEKIDIGGISLIRAAAKNYKDVVIVPQREDYTMLEMILKEGASTSLDQRKRFAANAFKVSASYDQAILGYFEGQPKDLNTIQQEVMGLRYGENPHQNAVFVGPFKLLEKLTGKDLSYNNLVDVDAAMNLIKEFKEDDPTFAVLKHTNPCGIATRSTVLDAWKAALAGDPISAFGGILVSNTRIDLATAEEINKIFYEVVIAPDFDEDAFELLSRKKKRILLKLRAYPQDGWQYKSLLDGMIAQEVDFKAENDAEFTTITDHKPTAAQLSDLEFAIKCVKHLKSNTIVLARNGQLIGMGCGQTSRVDACRQAIEKAKNMGFETEGCVMASDAFFPFPDCVELGAEAGVTSVVQPGGSINDQASIDACNRLGLSMVQTGIRHFKH